MLLVLVTNPIFDNMHMPKKSFSEPTIEDGGGKIALMDKNGDLSLMSVRQMRRQMAY